jgi:hypothetical protein
VSRLPERPERLVGRLEVERVALLLLQRRRPFDEHVMQRRRTRGSRAQYLTREPAPARTGLDHQERIGRALRLPLAIECARNARAEQRAHLRAGHEIAPGPARAATRREEARRGFVQRDLDEAIERDRAFSPDQPGKSVRRAGTGGQNARSPIRAKSCG